MSDIPSFPYTDLWEERVLRSVANLTRADAEEFLALAPQVPVRTTVTSLRARRSGGGAPALACGKPSTAPGSDYGVSMDVGIGLPATIAGLAGPDLLEWARRADARGFSTLGTIDRVVYGNYEPLIALAAAAAVTERIGLTTAILIAPFRRTPR